MIKKFLTPLTIALLFSLTLVTVNAAEMSLQVSASVAPPVVTPGNDGYVELTITNIGTKYVDNVKVSLESLDPPLIPITSFSASGLGGLAVGKSISTIFKFSVPSSTPSGFYVAKFTVSACNSGQICKDTSAYTMITVKSASTLQLASITPSSVKIGEKVKLNFILKNGGSNISNVILSWSNPALTPLGTSNRIFIQSIKANEVKQIPVNAIVKPDIPPGVYSFAVFISYIDKTGVEQKINTTVGITVTGEFNFVVSLDSQDTLLPSKAGSATIRIANAGKQEAKFLTVEVLPSNTFLEVTPNLVYVGNLKSDDYDTEKFNFKVASIPPGVYPFKLKLDYHDLYGNNYNETYEIYLRVSSPEELPKRGISSTTVLILIIFILVILYVAYRKRVKK